MRSDSAPDQQMTLPRSARPPISSRGLQQGQTPPAISLRDILMVVFKHKFKILSLFLLGLTLAPLLYTLRPVNYSAVATLMVTQGREYSRQNLGNEQAPVRLTLDQILGTESVIIRSNDVMDMAINRIGIGTIYPGMTKNMPEGVDLFEIARVSLRAGLGVQINKASNIMQVSFQNADPELAALLVNQIVEAYLEKRIQVLNTSKPRQFLENKVNEYQNRLRESEDRLEAFRQQHQVFALIDQKSMLIRQRSDLGIAIKAAQAQSKELQQKLSSLEAQTLQIPETLPVENILSAQYAVETELLVLERKEQDLLTKYREDTPFIEGVRNEIRLVKAFLAKQHKSGGGTTINSLHQNLQKDTITIRADLSSLDVKITELKHQLQEVDNDTRSIDLLEKSFREFQREQAANEKSWQVYAQKLEEARLSEDIDQQVLGSVSVIEKAKAPLIPEGKRKGLIFFLLAGAGLGLGAGLGSAFLLETLGQSMGTPQKAERLLGLPVLSTVSWQK